VETVIVPPASGAASAFGFLGAPVAHEAARSAPALLAETNWISVSAILDDLKAAGRAHLATAGISDVAVTREADARLFGQVHTLRIAIPGGVVNAESAIAIMENFAAAYRRFYARDPFGGALEIIGWRVTCTGSTPPLRLGKLARATTAPHPTARRLAWFPETEQQVSTPVHSRYALPPGTTITGPAIIEEDEATTVIPPGDAVSIDDHGNLVITVHRAEQRAAAAVTPLEQDPVSLEIMWSRLVTISEEMWLTVIRTAFSLIIGEAQDFACEILDAQGASLAHSPRAMPVFNIALMSAVQALLAEYPAQTLVPGDVLMTNDPWDCAGHLYDIAIVTPVFRDGRVVAFMGSVGHVSDIGGTKDRAGAREIFEEGIQLPATKLFAAGIANRDVFRIMERNVRNPQQVLGDVQALVAANALGAERLAAFMAEYGLPDLVELASVMQRRGEAAVREAIRKVPDGVYRGLTHFNASGEKLWVPLQLTVADDEIKVDYDGAPKQLSRGGINCTLTVTRAETMFALKCVFTPGIRATAGCYRPFSITAPEGSLFNCTRPASVGLRRLSMWYFVGTIFRALSGAVPGQVQAFTGLPTLVDLYGSDPGGGVFTDHVFVGGGQGGSARQDGKSGVIWPTSAANTAIELVEARIPVVVLEKALIAGSGGAGTHRGGLGQRLRLKRLRDDGLKLFVNVYPEGEGFTSDGLLGGEPGGRVRCFRHTNGSVHEYLVSTMVDLQDGEIIEVCVGGGAGFGPLAGRSPADVARDRADGYLL
jgi:5-oxoprolinase (ATP-hydrolysing)